MLVETELDEVKRICEERGIGPEKLLEEKLAPLQEKMSQSSGQLIGAITRHIDRNVLENMYTGIITEHTHFPLNSSHYDFDIFGIFLTEIHNPHKSLADEKFEKESNNSFDIQTLGTFSFLYHMDKPPQAPYIPLSMNRNGWNYSSTDKPRLELFIGDNEVIPLLQERLSASRYAQLSRQLGVEFPIDEQMQERLEEEQLTLFYSLRHAEREQNRLTKRRDNLLQRAQKNPDVAIDRDTHIELVGNEASIRLNSYTDIEEAKRDVNTLVRKGIDLGYHEYGLELKRQKAPGVTLHVDLKEYISEMKQTLHL